MHLHDAYGLGIRSNRALPGLRRASRPQLDVAVEFADDREPEIDPAAASTTATTGWGTMRPCDDGGRLLLFASHGGANAWCMRVSGDGRAIYVRWRGPIEFADVVAFVEVTGLATALALQGVPLLHGCGVDTGTAAFLVVGPAGAGKSTLAAAAVAGGHALVTDDIAALDLGGSDVHVRPGGTQLRINEDTARHLRWDRTPLRRLFTTPTLPPKLFAPLSTDDGTLCDRPRRLAAIFVLRERRRDGRRIDALAPRAALLALLRNTYGELALDARLRARLLPFWTRLARNVPAYAVVPPDDLAASSSLAGALAATANGASETARQPRTSRRRSAGRRRRD